MADHKVPPYVVGQAPSGERNPHLDFVLKELGKIRETIGVIASGLSQVYYVAPSKPREGMLAYAKSPWNPGSGDGLYVYKAGGWTFVV